jgi:hypothetical protein
MISLTIKDQVSHPYKTGKIQFLYIAVFIFLDGKQEDKRFLLFLKLNLPLISSNMQYDLSENF